MTNYDVCVIGGGPAGMAAALTASDNGARTLLIEREDKLGGILNQCIHNGFGLHYFKEELTGPEYAFRFRKLIENSNVTVLLGSIVTDINAKDKVLVVQNEHGISEIETKAIVLAMGCRERAAGSIFQCGYRPSGVFQAGTAQKLINTKGKLVGKEVVILGSGDIGLIMARRMTFEGAKVLRVLELMPYSSGLKRNIVQCLDDFNIPLEYNVTITKVEGKDRVTGIRYAKVDEHLNPIMSTEQFIACDTLLLSVGLIPENDLIANIDIDMDALTSGAVADEFRRTSVSGVFSCGNVLHVHDLADNASFEAITAGKYAAIFALDTCAIPECNVKITPAFGVRYVMPTKISKSSENCKVFFRVNNVYKSKKIVVRSGGNIILSKSALIFSPGEMESIIIDKSKVAGDITISLEDKTI